MQRNANSLRRKAKRTYFFERVRECERVFAPHRTRGYGRLSRRPHALFALLGATALSLKLIVLDVDFMVLWLHLRSVFSSIFEPGS